MMFRQSTRMIKREELKILIDSTITAGQGQAAMLVIAVVDCKMQTVSFKVVNRTSSIRELHNLRAKIYFLSIFSA